MSSTNPMSSISSASSSTTVATASNCRVAAAQLVDGPARRGDDDVHPARQRPQLLPDGAAAVHRQHPGAQPAAVLVHRLRHLHRQLAGRHEHQRGRRAGALLQRGQAVQQRQGERGGLAGARGGLPEDVRPASSGGIGLALDRGRLLVAQPGQSLQQRPDAGRGRRRWALSDVLTPKVCAAPPTALAGGHSHATGQAHPRDGFGPQAGRMTTTPATHPPGAGPRGPQRPALAAAAPAPGAVAGELGGTPSSASPRRWPTSRSTSCCVGHWSPCVGSSPVPAARRRPRCAVVANLAAGLLRFLLLKGWGFAPHRTAAPRRT